MMLSFLIPTLIILTAVMIPNLFFLISYHKKRKKLQKEMQRKRNHREPEPAHTVSSTGYRMSPLAKDRIPVRGALTYKGYRVNTMNEDAGQQATLPSRERMVEDVVWGIVQSDNLGYFNLNFRAFKA